MFFDIIIIIIQSLLLGVAMERVVNELSEYAYNIFFFICFFRIFAFKLYMYVFVIL